MARSRHDGHGRCGVCGDAGAVRRKREAANENADLADVHDRWCTCFECIHGYDTARGKWCNCDYCEPHGPECYFCFPDGFGQEEWRDHPAANQNNQAPLVVEFGLVVRLR